MAERHKHSKKGDDDDQPLRLLGRTGAGVEDRGSRLVAASRCVRGGYRLLLPVLHHEITTIRPRRSSWQGSSSTHTSTWRLRSTRLGSSWSSSVGLSTPFIPSIHAGCSRCTILAQLSYSHKTPGGQSQRTDKRSSTRAWPMTPQRGQVYRLSPLAGAWRRGGSLFCSFCHSPVCMSLHCMRLNGCGHSSTHRQRMEHRPVPPPPLPPMSRYKPTPPLIQSLFNIQFIS